MCGRAARRASPKSRLRLADARRGDRAGALDFGEPRGQPVGRFAIDLVGLARALGERGDLLAELRLSCVADSLPTARSCSATRARGLLGSRQVLEQHGDVVARGFGGAVERLAVPLQSSRCWCRIRA